MTGESAAEDRSSGSAPSLPGAPAPLETPLVVGRYELTHELGRGGMGSVYLARLRGVAGFVRWLAVKRVHRHLSREQRFIDMFIDEARIAAQIVHPNVAQVQELGQAEGEYFLAMEYLHGEHLGALVAAAFPLLGGIPHRVAASVISAAARGLHHAHEATDGQGRPLRIVHRDVSPHNIFITYDGVVKLTDFGVAKAADRLAHTETGNVKGKWAYMSPEQVMGEALDRRSDIFALGTVLWETTTGRRLFKAESQVRTAMRITSGRVLRPSDLVEGYPPELERIALKALARRPADRYATASELADDLDRFARAHGGVTTPTELAELMGRVFEERRASKDAMLHQSAEETVTLSLSDGQVVVEEVGEAPDRSAVRRRARPPARGRSIARWSLVVLAIFALGTAASFLVRVLLAEPRSTVQVASRPSGAAVIWNDTVQDGTTPLVIEDVPPGRHRIELRLEGYRPHRATFDVRSQPVDLSYHLRPLDAHRPGAAEPTDAPAPSRPPEEVEVPDDSGATAGPSLTDEPTLDPSSGSAPRAPARPRPVRPEPAPSEPPAAREPAYLNLMAVPYARVTINGRGAGGTPLVRREIPSGNVVVHLRFEGGEERTLRFNAQPGQTVSKRVTLD